RDDFLVLVDDEVDDVEHRRLVDGEAGGIDLFGGERLPLRLGRHRAIASINSPKMEADISVDRVAEVAARLEHELAKAIVGQQRVVREILIAFLAGGHCLLRGVPGLAKTLLIKTLADAVDLRFNRIQFTPDLMPSDILGTEVIEEDRATGKRVIR